LTQKIIKKYFLRCSRCKGLPANMVQCTKKTIFCSGQSRNWLWSKGLSKSWRNIYMNWWGKIFAASPIPLCAKGFAVAMQHSYFKKISVFRR
jgi:hypothetical protein